MFNKFSLEDFGYLTDENKDILEEVVVMDMRKDLGSNYDMNQTMALVRL